VILKERNNVSTRTCVFFYESYINVDFIELTPYNVNIITLLIVFILYLTYAPRVQWYQHS